MNARGWRARQERFCTTRFIKRHFLEGLKKKGLLTVEPLGRNKIERVFKMGPSRRSDEHTPETVKPAETAQASSLYRGRWFGLLASYRSVTCVAQVERTRLNELAIFPKNGDVPLYEV
jgi:hypothetical protein